MGGAPDRPIVRRNRFLLFNSIQFFVFFPIVTAGYFMLPHRFRWLWLLAASCYFYMAFIPVFILILCFTITVDYFAGILIEESQGRRRKTFLMASIVANVGALAFFNYLNFLNTNLAEFAALFHLSYPIPFKEIEVLEECKGSDVGDNACHQKRFTPPAMGFLDQYPRKIVDRDREAENEDEDGNEGHVEVATRGQ